jgi:hypothetical protein
MVMKKLLSIIALLMAASMLFWLAGCGGDDDDDECDENVAPKVASVSPNGGDVFANSVITVSLSKVVDSVTITMGGAAVTPTSADNKVFTFSPPAEGANQALAITAEDACGDGLDPAFAGVTFNVGAIDPDPPVLAGDKCDPKDGADGVDPAGYEAITIVCNENLASADIVSVEPEIDPAPAVEVDGDTVTLAFLGGYKLSNEMEVEIVLSVTDLAANSAELTYSFTTMSKEE